MTEENKNDDVEEGSETKEVYIKGVPPAVLLPAKNYLFKTTNKYHVIEIPRYGKYMDLAPEIFTEESGEFEILNEEAKLLFVPGITKVLFAAAKYPDLESNQLFSIVSIKMEEDTVSIAGMVINMMLPVDEDGKPLGGSTKEGE